MWSILVHEALDSQLTLFASLKPGSAPMFQIFTIAFEAIILNVMAEAVKQRVNGLQCTANALKNTYFVFYLI